MKKLKVGIIGCGRIANMAHFPALSQIEDVRIKYACDLLEEKALAIKEKYPDCLIVFGGHDVPDNFDMLESYSFIDVLCHGEGEDTTRELIEAYCTNQDDVV